MKVDRQRLLVGMFVIAGWLLMLGFFLGQEVMQPGPTVAVKGRTRYVEFIDTIRATLPLSRQVLLLAAVTVVVAVVLAFFTGKRASALKDVWHTLGFVIAGGMLGFVTTMPLKAWLPPRLLWFVVAPLYMVAMAGVVLYARYCYETGKGPLE